MSTPRIDHVAFLQADRAWFAENADRTLRYHWVTADLAAQLISDGGIPKEWLAGQEFEEVLLLTYVAPTGDDAVRYSMVLMDKTETRLRLETAGDNDGFGMWLIFGRLPMLPPITSQDVGVRGTGVPNWLAKLAAA